MNDLNKMKYQVPSGMRNELYDFFFDKCDELVDCFVSANANEEYHVENIRNTYSIKTGSLNDLKSISEDIFCFNFNFINRLYDFIKLEKGYVENGDESINTFAKNEALRIIRNEMLRFPFMIKNRGSIRFYDMLSICGEWNFPNVITLCPQDDVLVKLGKSHTNIDLSKHGSDVLETSLCSIPIIENYLAHKFEETTLDSGLLLDTSEQSTTTLDVKYDINDTPYKRNVFIGLDLNEDRFSNSLYSNEIGYYMLNVLSLYKKATENIIFSLISSIKINSSGEIKGICDIVNHKDILYDENKDLTIKYYDDNGKILYTTKPDSLIYKDKELKLISFYEGFRIKSIGINEVYIINQKTIRFSYENADNAQLFSLKRYIKIYSDLYFIIIRENSHNQFQFIYSNDRGIYSYNGEYVRNPNIKLYWNEMNYEITIDVSSTDADLSDYNNIDLSAYKYDSKIQSVSVYNGDKELTKITYKKPIDVIEKMYLCNIITRMED